MHHLRPLFALCTSLPVCSVFADMAPNAGRLIRDIESVPLSIPRPQRLDLTLPDNGNGQADIGGPKLSVKDFISAATRPFRAASSCPCSTT